MYFSAAHRKKPAVRGALGVGRIHPKKKRPAALHKQHRRTFLLQLSGKRFADPRRLPAAHSALRAGAGVRHLAQRKPQLLAVDRFVDQLLRGGKPPPDFRGAEKRSLSRLQLMSSPRAKKQAHGPLRARSAQKRARRKLMHLSLRRAFARTDCTPMTHCVPMGRNS